MYLPLIVYEKKTKTMSGGENGGYQKFLLLSQYFQKASGC